ncbi:MAG TPA: hypothetical protein VIW29_01545 [Polyangiaceae bacterium]
MALLVVAASFRAASAYAQTPPPPAPASDDEDLEVPASLTPAATPCPTVPAPPTSVSSAASSEPAAPPAATAPRADAAQPTAKTTAVAGSAAQPASEPAAGSREPQPPTTTKPEPSWLDGFRLSGYIQGQYQHSRLSEDQLQQGGAPFNQNQFLVRRARLRIDRVWDFASAALELDANTVRGPRVGIRRAEAALFYQGKNAAELPPLVQLSVGVMDIPFGYELNESARTRWFMERSQGSLSMFPTEPDVGAKLSGGVSFVRYAVAVMNGEPVDENGFPRDPNNAKDVLARFTAEGPLNDKLQLSGGTSFAYGKGFHAGQDAGKSRLSWLDANEDGAAQAGEVMGVLGSAATPSENFERWAIGLEAGAWLKTKLGLSHLYGEAYVATNYDRGVLPSDPVGDRVDARQAGAYVALTQELFQYGVVGFRAAFYDPNSDLIEVRGGKALPKTQTITTLSPLVGLVLPQRARLLFQYDFIRDYLARDAVGVPTNADNNQRTLRLQVEL